MTNFRFKKPDTEIAGSQGGTMRHKYGLRSDWSTANRRAKKKQVKEILQNIQCVAKRNKTSDRNIIGAVLHQTSYVSDKHLR